MKLVKEKRKMGGRDHRQYKRGRDIREYYDTGRSERLLQGYTLVRHSVLAVVIITTGHSCFNSSSMLRRPDAPQGLCKNA